MKPEYVIKRMNAPDWNAVPEVRLVHQPWLEPCGISAKAQVCHDGEKIYVRMTAKEEAIRATLSGPLEQVCSDSCLEFFFAPLPGDERYFNFEWNMLGALYLGFGGKRDTRVRQIVKDAKALFDAKPFRTQDGWGIEYAIPAAFVRMYMPEFALCGEAACNFYKCGDLTEKPHYLAWANLTSERPDYHRRQDFGTLIFE